MPASEFNDKFVPRDENLRQYATERQWETLEAYWREGSDSAAAAALGLKSRTSIHKALGAVKQRAARHGYSPQNPNFHIPSGVPDGYAMRGQSAFVDADGNLLKRWDKTKQAGRDPEEALQLPDPKKTTKLSTMYDADGGVIVQWRSEKPEDVARERAWQDFAKELAADLPRVEASTPPMDVSSDLCAAYPVGDHHIGMLAWHEETGGDNYNIDEASRLLMGAMDHLVGVTPASDVGLVMLLGDLFHYDGHKPVTPTHGFQLDADSRPSQMIRTAIRLARYTIDAARRRHSRVHVIVEIGNHDLSNSLFLAECLHSLYENEPRVTVDNSPRHYHYFEFGKNLIGSHHGHGAKLPNLPLIMATDQPAAWGRTKYRYIHTGHVHHDQVKDIQGVKVESCKVLAPADAHADREGYRSMRDMKAIVYHKEYGEVSRHTVNPDMLL